MMNISKRIGTSKHIKERLEKIGEINNLAVVHKFDNITKHFTEAYNIGFSSDGFVQAISIGEHKAAMKIIKLSKAEVVNPMNTSNINKINKAGLDNSLSIGTNVWREVVCLQKLSPDVSGLDGFPMLYGFFISHWSDFMEYDDSLIKAAKTNKSLRDYAMSREKEEKCVIIIMELFDDHLLDWTHIAHGLNEWKSVWTQILQILQSLTENKIVHNDAHAKNFLVRYQESKVPLIVLADFGWSISTDFDLNPAEKLLYRKFFKAKRDLDVIRNSFCDTYIKTFQLRKLKQIQTIDKVDKFMPGLVGEIQNSLKQGGPTRLWLRLVEIIAQNYEEFRDLRLLDDKKLMPSTLVEVMDKTSKSSVSDTLKKINLL